MFTWICPQCGREVPPAYTDCPDCAAKAAQGGATAAPAAAAPPSSAPSEDASQSQPVPQPAQPAPAQVQVRPYVPPPPAAHAGLPTWLMAIVFALAFLGLGAGIYWIVGYVKGRTAPSVTVESPAAKAGAKVHPLQKYIEIAGVRFTAEKNKPFVKFVVINHAPVDIQGLAGNVTVWGRTQKSEEEAAGTFSFTTNLGPFESKELTAPLNTKLEMVELPDWQNVSTDVQITGPPGF